MKKTEKIELRVDHAEKERLSAIAERRGHTVSDVVRDALAGELGVARADYPKWPGVVSIVAVVLSGVSLGLLVSNPAYRTDGLESLSIKPTYVSARVSTDADAVAFDITVLTDTTREFSLQSVTGDTIRMTILATPDKKSGLLLINSEACIVTEQECRDLNPQPVSIQMAPAIGSSAYTYAAIGTPAVGSERLEVSFNASTYWPKPAAS